MRVVEVAGEDRPRAARKRKALLQFVRFAIGDINLTVWEANFVNGMKHLAAWTGGPLPSRRQAVIIEHIRHKLLKATLAPPIDEYTVLDDEDDGLGMSYDLGEDDRLVWDDRMNWDDDPLPPVYRPVRYGRVSR